MLGDRNAMATVAVRDLETAREFYEETLGLKITGTEGEEAISFGSGSTTLLVYRSRYAGTSKATAVTWAVGDEIDEIVRTLREKGVTFEHYDMPDMKMEEDIHVMGEMKVAWLKDPDGNILSIVNG